MKVLVACEYSGTVRDAFRAWGHTAMSCDLLETDVPGPHYRGDVRDVLDAGWDLMVAHPPCTYLCSSGLHWNARGRMVDGRPRGELTEEALDFVRMLLDAPIERIALENPQGCIGTRIRPATQYVHPYQFGDDASKKTGLWLKGLLPLVANPAHYVKPRMVCKVCASVSPYDRAFGHGCQNCGAEAGLLLPRWGNQTDSGQNKLGPSDDRWKLRSETFPGLARAMALQWGERVDAGEKPRFRLPAALAPI